MIVTKACFFPLPTPPTTSCWAFSKSFQIQKLKKDKGEERLLSVPLLSARILKPLEHCQMVTNYPLFSTLHSLLPEARKILQAFKDLRESIVFGALSVQ